MKLLIFLLAFIIIIAQIIVLVLKKKLIVSSKSICIIFSILIFSISSIFIGLNYKIYLKCLRFSNFQDLLFIYFMFMFYYQVCALISFFERGVLKKNVLYEIKKNQGYFLNIQIKSFVEIFLIISLYFFLYEIEYNNSFMIILFLLTTFLIIFLFKKIGLIKKNDFLMFEILKVIFCYVILQTFLNIGLAIIFILSTDLYEYIKFNSNKKYFNMNRRIN